MATSESENFNITLVDPTDAYFVISLLPDEMVKYELESQGLLCDSTIVRRRTQLSKLFEEDTYKQIPLPVVLNVSDNISLCHNYLKQWENEYERSKKTSDIKDSILLRIKFLQRRLNYIQIPRDLAHSEPILKEVKEAVTKFVETVTNDKPDQTTPLDTDLNCSSITNFNLSNIKSDFIQDQMQIQLNNIHQSRLQSFPQIPCSPQSNASNIMNSQVCHISKVQIWKWGIKFHGTSSHIPVIEFIRRIRELAVTRGATTQNLYDSACELFEGNALQWFRAGLNSKSFTNWEELEQALLNDFENYDYSDDLLEYIKNRLQKPSEKIVDYFACMEDLFIKLGSNVSELFKLKIIRRNLRAEFIKSLSTFQFQTTNQLKEHCKLFEHDMIRISKRDVYLRRGRENSPSRHVRFNSLEDFETKGNSDYHRFEACSFYRTNPLSESRPSSPFLKSRSNSFDRQMEQLSIREEPSFPNFQIPPPNYSGNNFSNNYYNQERYYAPSRPNFHNPHGSENDHRRSQNGTPISPAILKRPS